MKNKMNRITEENFRWFGYGKYVRISGTRYRLISKPDDHGNIMAVKEKDFSRYSTLRARSNFMKVTPDQLEEMASYEEQICLIGAEPVGAIRIIDPHYNNKFVVKDLDYIYVNDIKSQVVGVESDSGNGAGACHFRFLSGVGYKGQVFHICEFAEICERSHVKVELMND